jgi:hypothetical protein
MRTVRVVYRRPGGRVLVLGAGASHGVSYAHQGKMASPLDRDFFDLLQRLAPSKSDRDAVSFILNAIRTLPHECRRSMERSFYTLHLGAYLARKLGAEQDVTDEKIIADFARCIQGLLRAAHRMNTCGHHELALRSFLGRDTVISFNYDLVCERALRRVAESRRVPFGPWVYGTVQRTYNLPTLLKLHGSSNWRLTNDTFDVLTHEWSDFDAAPGYQGHRGKGTTFPIFLPFWDKRIEEEPWLSMWKAAFSRLRRASAVIVWGYSLPTTDIKAQQLFSLALRQRRFSLCVIDPVRDTRDGWRELAPEAQYWEYDGVQDFLNYPPKWWDRPTSTVTGPGVA